jgi:HPt (histidine-containing phosphotransfer) domain-containing protein
LSGQDQPRVNRLVASIRPTRLSGVACGKWNPKMSENRRQPGAALVYRDQPAFEYESFALLSRRIGVDESRRRLAGFMREARFLLDDLCAGSARGDMTSLKALADRLKGPSARLGLARLAAISRELEQVAAGAGVDRIETLRHAASEALHDAQPFIDEVLAAS